MKRTIVSLAVTFILGISAVFADNVPDGNDKAREKFTRDFPGASLVQWGQQDEYLKVSFVLNNVRVMAFFDRDGEFQGSVNTIFLDQLPIAVRTSFDKRFKDAVILEIFEITNPEITRYKIVLDTKGTKYTAFLYYDGTIGQIQKTIN